MEYEEVDTEDVYFEDALSSDTAEEPPEDYSGPTGEDFHLEMDYEDRCSGEF